MRGSRAEVIRPNWADDTLLFGVLKLTLFKMLKNSARNCRPTFFVTFVTFSSATSVLKYWGPAAYFFRSCQRSRSRSERTSRYQNTAPPSPRQGGWTPDPRFRPGNRRGL